MTRNRSLFRRLAEAFGMLGTAGRAAEAVRESRSPAPLDLQRLGISAIAFGAINKN